MADSKSLTSLRCVYLTCKSMMVYGEDFEQDPDFQADMADFQCLKTCTNMGPDKQRATLDLCSDPNRRCYQEF